MNEDEKWMRLALEQAKKAQALGEVPIGAVLIKDGLLIAQTHNQPISTNDASAHAEIQLIRVAGEKLNNYRLTGTSMYVTLEPCMMCLGAIMHARVERIIFGAYDNKTGVCGSYADLKNEAFFNHKIKVTRGVLKNDCSNILQEFFKLRRLKI